MIMTTLISSCHWKTLCTFLFEKEKTWKRIFNTNSELTQNRIEKQIMPSKTTRNWLFNHRRCYLFIACFDWKIGVFQQTVVRVYYILNVKILGDILKCWIILYIRIESEVHFSCLVKESFNHFMYISSFSLRVSLALFKSKIEKQFS